MERVSGAVAGGRSKHFRALWLTAGLLTIVLLVLVAIICNDWLAGRRVDKAAWDDIRKYAVDLADRADAEVYATTKPCNSSGTAGDVEADLVGRSAADLAGKVSRLRALLREDGWRLEKPADQGQEGVRAFGDRQAYVVIDLSGLDPTSTRYFVGMESEHCILGWF